MDSLSNSVPSRNNLFVHLRRFIGFAVMPVLSMGASVLLLPLISDRFGSASLIALSVGQGIGAIGAVPVSLAWPLIGGNRVARAKTDSERQRIYRVSLYSRFMCLIPLSVICSVASGLLSGDEYVAGVLFSLGFLFNGMTASWYFSGLGTPRTLIVNEGLVRLVGYAVAAAGVIGGFGLWWYALCTLIAPLVMLLLNWGSILRGAGTSTPGVVKEAWLELVAQTGGTVSRVLQGTFYHGVTSVYSLMGAGGLDRLSAADQIKRLGTNATALLPQTFISWIGAANQLREQSRRQRRVMYLMWFTAGCAFILWMGLGPVITSFLFQGKVTISTGEHLLLASVISANLLVQGIEMLLLIPRGEQATVYRASSISAILGLVALVLMSVPFQVYGALGALLISRIFQLVVYAVAVRRKSPKQSAEDMDGDTL